MRPALAIAALLLPSNALDAEPQQDAITLRATYTFTARSYLRLVDQYVETRREPTLHREPVEARSAGFSASLLFGYKLNWQTLLFAGYGDNRELSERDALERADRHFFVKLYYALQR